MILLEGRRYAYMNWCTLVVYPLGLWSRFSGVVKVRFGYG